MRKQFTIFLILIFVLGLVPVNFSSAEDLSNKLSGRILLQVEGVGQAWYIDPGTKQRAFLGRPADAFQIMRELGLGISEKDYNSFNGFASKNLSGRILLRVEANGEAYYVNPTDLKMYYLGRPADAFKVMREKGLGITDKDLNKVPVFEKYKEQTDSDLSAIDLLNKKISELEEKMKANTPKVIEQSKERSVADIVKEWSPLVVLASCECHSVDLSAAKNWFGSGFVTLLSDGRPMVVTNRHVTEYQETSGNTLCTANSCDFYLLNGEKYTTFRGSVQVNKDDNVDMAAVFLSNVSTYVKNLATNTYQKAYCSKEPEIGDKIVILGYPGIGSNSGITATEGIISGYEGSYYVTSAKIDHGNSGGIAVLVKDNCIVGMPSASVSGSIESLGRILSYKEFVK